VYFEDFEVGQTLTSPSRTVAAEDVDKFINLVGLLNPIFMSDEGARAAGHPRRLVPGPLQLSLAMGLAQAAGWFDRVVAVARFDELIFKRAVHPGETLTLKADVLDKRPTSNPRRGLVNLSYDLLKQDNEPALTAKGTYLFLRRG